MSPRIPNRSRTPRWLPPTPAAAKPAGRAPRQWPTTAAAGTASAPRSAPARATAGHPLTDTAGNARLQAYEARVKQAFDNIVPVLRRISGLQHEPDFVSQAQAIAQTELGLSLPTRLLEDAWVTQLDMRGLYAWCVFVTYLQLCDEFYRADPLQGHAGAAFQAYLEGCGFHLMDITPCADGRLAHAISYVLRLPHGEVRRRSYAGALFDVEDSVAKWTETELRRFREGQPNTADAGTRYLKVVVYHYSSRDPDHAGCAAHGSDTARAAQAGLARLNAFQQAVQNSFCCGASVDLLLLGMDTDTDAICVHLPDADGQIDLDDQPIEAAELYTATERLPASEARAYLEARVAEAAPAGATDTGMIKLAAQLLENNFSQIDYVRQFHAGAYADSGHAERFIGAGIGFEEVQLRNLTYFAYLATVEEGAPDLDVGIKIFRKLYVDRGLPAPVIVRFDYHGGVPGARERAIGHAERVNQALHERYPELTRAGLLHTLVAIRDCDDNSAVEVVGSSLLPAAGVLPQSGEPRAPASPRRLRREVRR